MSKTFNTYLQVKFITEKTEFHGKSNMPITFCLFLSNATNFYVFVSSSFLNRKKDLNTKILFTQMVYILFRTKRNLTESFFSLF